MTRERFIKKWLGNKDYQYTEENRDLMRDDLDEVINQALRQPSCLGAVIWRCIENITNIYGETIFTKGLVYEQVKAKEYAMMLIDNKIEESEVSSLEDYFTSI